MTETLIVASVFANGESRIAASANLDAALRQWSRRFGEFLPVVAFPGDPVLFARLAQVPRLPTTVPIQRAADLLHRAPISPAAQQAVFRHIRKLGPSAGPLFAAWYRAVGEVGK